MPQKHKVRHTGPSKPQLCGSKRCYKTKREAEQVKDEQELLTTALELSIYRCIDCGMYHLTRQQR